MSLIYGVVNLRGDNIDISLFNDIKDSLPKFNYDKCDDLKKDNLLFGCNMQWITKEDRYEKIPRKNSLLNISITADVILDNRDELMNELKINKLTKSVICDSELILLAYKKWGEQTAEHLLGDFAFVIYDEEKERFYCARDHVGKRTLYYGMNKSYFAFSTVMEPLLMVFNRKRSLNEKWLTDFFNINNQINSVEVEETIYEDIKQLPPAHYMVIDKDGLKKVKYWNPLKVKPLTLKSDKEYEEKFLEVLRAAVKCRLRADGDIGIMLSGGLDSGSIASIAAPILNERREKLKAFSFLPIKEYKNNLPKRLLPDEHEYIESISNKYKNIELCYCRVEEKNSISNVEENIDIFEEPYKIIENMFWVNEVIEKSAISGCKVLLDGQFGNLTISYGDFPTYLYSLLKSFKFISLNKEISEAAKRVKGRPITAYKVLLKKILQKHNLMKLDKTDNITIINDYMNQKWNSSQRIEAKGLNKEMDKIHDIEEIRRVIVNNVFFSHLGEFETKISLAKKIARRDPTRDKRVIEFCMSVPMSQYVRYGRERFLIRRSMKDILPDKIRLNYSVRGLQAADWLQRLESEWLNIVNLVNKSLDDREINKYINSDEIRALINEIGRDIKDSGKGLEIRNILIVYVFIKFMHINNLRREERENERMEESRTCGFEL